MTRQEFDQALLEIGFTSQSFRDALWATQDRSLAFKSLSPQEFQRRSAIWKNRNPEIFAICNNPDNDNPEKQKEFAERYF